MSCFQGSVRHIIASLVLVSVLKLMKAFQYQILVLWVILTLNETIPIQLNLGPATFRLNLGIKYLKV